MMTTLGNNTHSLKTRVSNLDVAPTESGILVSDEALGIFQWVFYGSMCMVVDLFGTVTNIINIVCFVKQGFRDSVNVSLIGLAISDLGCLLPLFWTNLCFVPAFQEADLPFDAIDLQYLPTSWPHVMFTRVTSWITALITLERCMCITMPLKVKNIITPKRVTVIIVCVFVIIISGASPVYYANRYAMKFDPKRNRTILGLVYSDDRERVEQISFAISNVFVPFSAFFTVIICTITLVFELRKKAKWRLQKAAPVNADVASERDQKVAKMVVMISTLFIACFIPTCFIFIAMIVEPQLSIDGKYKNTIYVLVGLGSLLESLNSSSNIFIYYHMSSRYRLVFRHLFKRGQKGKRAM